MSNSSMEYVPVYTAYGQLAGEIIRLTLESKGIPAILNQESAGQTYGLTVGPLGEVQVMVPANRLEEAETILDDMEEGLLETDEDLDGESPIDSDPERSEIDEDEV